MITVVLQATECLSTFLRNSSEFETNIVSAERIQEYTKIEQEVCI